MSWNFTQTTKPLTLNFPKLDFSRFVRSREKERSDFESIYVNMDSPKSMKECIRVRHNPIDSYSTEKEFRTAYSPKSRKGYSFSISDYLTWRDTNPDGSINDNPVKITISCSTVDGTNVTGAILTGADWLPLITRAAAFGLNVVYDVSDDAMTLAQSQTMLDSIMHGSTELKATVTEQA